MGGWQISRAEPPSVMGTWGGQTPGGGNSTRKVKTIFSWGWQRAAQSGGEGGGFQPSPKGWTPQYQGAFERRWHLWPPLRAQSGPPRHPRRAEECRLQVPLGRLSGALANQTFPAKPPRSSPKSPCRCYRKRSEKRRRPLRVPVRRPRSLSRYTRALRSRAVARAEGRGRVCACAGKAALPAAAAAPVPPLPRRARPVPVPGGGPSRRGAASPSPPAFPTARPPPAGLRRLPPSGSRRESGSERARGRAEAARFGAAALERGAREDAGPPLRVRSLVPRLPHSARSHPFPA